MLSEKEIEALKNGAFGVTRSGRKVQYAGECENSHRWVLFHRMNPQYAEGIIEDYDEFGCYSERMEHRLDIVGLWEDKPEPFDLESALAGKPVILRDGSKGVVLKQIDDTLIGYFDKCSPFSWELNGDANISAESKKDIIGMWKEPEPIKPSADDLPKPIREFGNLETVWYVNKTKDRYAPYGVTKNGDWLDNQYASLSRGCYYATEEDCRAVCNWLMNR